MEEKKENIDNRLKEEYKRLQKNLNLKKDINADFKNEIYFSDSSNSGMGSPMTVNTILGDEFSGSKWSNKGRLAATLSQEEALNLSIERAINSGAPINNISFYDEVNFLMTQLGHLVKAPIDIKEALKKMINVKA